MWSALRAGSLTLVRLSRLLIAAGLLAAGAASFASAADHQASTAAMHFKVSNCDYHNDQNCPAAPATNSCHFRGEAQDRGCTPGVLNPAVTQSTIKRTVCRTGWTSTIRPPTSYTDPLKLQELRAYGDGGQISLRVRARSPDLARARRCPVRPAQPLARVAQELLQQGRARELTQGEGLRRIDQPGQGPAANRQLAEVRESRRPWGRRWRERRRRRLAGQELFGLQHPGPGPGVVQQPRRKRFERCRRP